MKMRKVLAHGVFDVLHDGHLQYFEAAKKHGDYLVVSVTSDRCVNKGPGRPHFDQGTRMRMLKALSIVDEVLLSDSPRATDIIKHVRPAFYVKGPDYKNQDNDVTGGISEEIEAVKSIGGQIIFTDKPTHSSSQLINKFFNSFTEEQNLAIEKIKSLGGMKAIAEIFNEISKYQVTVIGEPIVDTYVFCDPEGISSKSPTVSARYLKEENYAGGSLAIANHLADFVRGVSLYAPHGKELYFQEIKKNQVDKRIAFHNDIYANYVTPRKTRYIESGSNQRIFELTNITPQIWQTNDPKTLIHHIRASAKDSHMSFLCDFGHGLFEDRFTLFDVGYVALNCQTNSSNFGFNPYTKHKDFDYLSIDLKEARVAFHDRNSDAKSLFDKIGSHNVSMTLGPAGALYKRNAVSYKAPAFSDKIVDTIGAGDAYFAITSLLVRAGAPVELVPFVGNMFAGLKTKIIGNKFSVTKAQLFKALEAILK